MATTRSKMLSVVVPAFNEEKLIRQTLRQIKTALQAFQGAGWKTEIIVCDNNSTDRTAEIARDEGAQTIFEPRNQIARARNTGASLARGDWLVFVDADSLPSPELFQDLLETIETGQCIGGGCTVRMDERHRVGDLVTAGWNMLSRWKKWAAGSFVFCERAAFEKVGRFNLDLYASEEIDLSKRLKRHARTLGKRLVILHKYPMLTSCRKLRLYSRSELLKLLWHFVRHPVAGARDQQSCYPWYDGRR